MTATHKATGREGDREMAQDDGGSAQFITFLIGQQAYGADIMAVREIRAWSPETPLPNTASHIRGVVNLRGLIIPVIDLRRRFGLGATDPTTSHVTVIVSIRDRLAGLLVDGVSDIIAVPRAAVLPVPDIAAGEAPAPEAAGAAASRFLDGLVTHEGQMIAIVALDHIVDLAILPAAAAA